MPILRLLKSFHRNQQGAALIEYASILSLGILLAVVTLEYGWYFLQQLDANRQVSVAAQRIQLNPETAIQPSFEGGFFQGSLCAEARQGGFTATHSCGTGWDIAPGEGVFAYNVLVLAEGPLESLTGLIDPILPEVISSRDVISFDAGDCSYKEFQAHPGCTVTVRERTYRCSAWASSGSSADLRSEGSWLTWNDWFLPTCTEDNVLGCDWDGYPGSFDEPCGPSDTDCEMTLDPGPHMCSTAHPPPCPPCSSGGGGGGNGNGNGNDRYDGHGQPDHDGDYSDARGGADNDPGTPD